MNRNVQEKIPGEQAGHFKDHHQPLTDQLARQQETHEEQWMSHHNTDSESVVLFPLGRGDESTSGNVLISATQPDLFVVLEVIRNWPVKDDVSSMEYPIFSLSKNRDTHIRVYSHIDRSIRIIPSAVGTATVLDKNILIYCISQIVRGHDVGVRVSHHVRVDIYPFLLETRRSTGGAAYERAVDMCRRLKSITIETNVKTNEKKQLRGFGLIEDCRVTAWTKNGKGALELELTISEWLYRVATDFDTLTPHPGCFSLGQALERRLYELARKHCGDKAQWKINLPLLLEKTGSSQTLRRFKQEIKEVAEHDPLPDYRMFPDESVKPNKLVIIAYNNVKLVCETSRADKLSQVSYFLRKKLA